MSGLGSGARLDEMDAVTERGLALDAPQIAPLEQYRRSLDARPWPPPHFDPFDGGVEARLLVLLETPGPSRAAVRFVSRDNRTGTAANLRRAFAAAGLKRTDSILWNTVPWVLGAEGQRARPPRAAEIAAGLAVLPGLLDLLPRLRVVVLAGRVAGLAVPVIDGVRPHVGVVTVPHPSPTYVNTSPDIYAKISAGFVRAAEMI